jgi:threonine dehydratase
VILVEDDELRSAADLIAETVGVLVEPAGAAGVAALLRPRPEVPGERVAVLLTGSAA